MWGDTYHYEHVCRRWEKSLQVFPLSVIYGERAKPLIDLKEHAILALRNILEDNAENQDVVESIKPVNQGKT